MTREQSQILHKLTQLADGDTDLVDAAFRNSEKPRYRKSLWEKLTGKPGTVYTGDSASINDVIAYIENHR